MKRVRLLRENEYRAWIDNINVDVTNRCAEYTLQMQAAFPELIRVRGHYYHPLLGARPHWWLKTPSGEIVDPTARQFFTGGNYDEWDESEPEPTGKCVNCGEFCYDGRSMCSNECSRSYIEFLTK